MFSSSILVMQPTVPGKVLTESSPGEAEWDYPKSKLAAEQVIAENRGDTRVVILRIAGVYDEDSHCIPLTQQVRRIYEEESYSHFFPGNLEHGQSFVHLDDLVSCFKQVIQRRGDLGPYELFLIGEPDVVSYGEMQDIIGEELHGTKWSTIRIPKVVAKAETWAEDKLGQDPSSNLG